MARRLKNSQDAKDADQRRVLLNKTKRYDLSDPVQASVNQLQELLVDKESSCADFFALFVERY